MFGNGFRDASGGSCERAAGTGLRGAAMPLQGHCQSGAGEVTHDVIRAGLCFGVASVPGRPAFCRARAGGDGRPARGQRRPQGQRDLRMGVADRRRCSPRDYGYLRTTWTKNCWCAYWPSARASRSARPRSVGCSSDTACDWVGPSRSWAVPGPRPVGCGVCGRFGGGSPLPRDEVAVYVDEVDIHLNPKIGPDWMLCGQQKTVLTPGKNEKRYLAGAWMLGRAG